MPVVHALIQAREDLERLITSVPPEYIWRRPGGAASIGFHVRHAGGALDRLFTYARGETLSEAQRTVLKAEGAPGAGRRGQWHHRKRDGATAGDTARLASRRPQGRPRRSSGHRARAVVPRRRAHHAPRRSGADHCTRAEMSSVISYDEINFHQTSVSFAPSSRRPARRGWEADSTGRCATVNNPLLPAVHDGPQPKDDTQ
jgi:hypothetical protein